LKQLLGIGTLWTWCGCFCLQRSIFGLAKPASCGNGKNKIL
jgi:hypothetical protein